MEDERAGREDGQTRQMLGDVARDVVDHTTMIVRDRVKLMRLEARRVGEHVKTDVAPRVLFGTAAAVCALLAVTFGLIAIFWAVAWAIGSVPWTFAIFAGAFVVFAAFLAGFSRRQDASLARRPEERPGALARVPAPPPNPERQRRDASGSDPRA